MTEEREIELFFGKAMDCREDELFEKARQRRIDAQFYEQAVKIEASEQMEKAA